MLSLLVYVLHKTLNYAFFDRSRAEAEKKRAARAARFLVVLLIKPVASLTLPFAVVGLILKRSIVKQYSTLHDWS